MFTTAFWIAAFERALKSAANAALVAVGASDTGVANLFELDGGNLAGFSAAGFVISVLMSVSSGVVSPGPSIAPKAEVDSALAHFPGRGF